MILYHYSEKRYDLLRPQIGPRRHSTEHARANGMPVIWLTDDGERAPSICEWNPKFKHVVNVVEDDFLLEEDKSFSGSGIPRIYSYAGELTPSEIVDYKV